MELIALSNAVENETDTLHTLLNTLDDKVDTEIANLTEVTD